MTRDVIAEFSCSLNNNGTFKQYHVVTGSSFTDSYSETLDSAVILLSQVSNADRLINIQPYDFVRIYDAASWNGTIYTFDHTYLVDNYDEKEDRITDGRFFSYTINLMSMTKLLEKIQCPNLNITHNLDSMGGLVKKTIFQKICEYMDLFVPKIKMSYSDNGTIKWQYKPLIENPGIKHEGYYEREGHNFSEQLSITNATVGSIHTVSFISADLIGKSVDFNGMTVALSNQYLEFYNDGGQTFYPSLGEVEFKVKSSRNMQGTITFDADIFLKTISGNYISSYYTPKIDYTAFYNKFNITSADLGSSCYTLKQLLTILMNQVGCIPTVRNLKLGFLDFNADAGDFALNGDATVGNTVNYVQKSLSSDSFVNTLVNMPSSVLDSSNEVISETLGFRDKSNALLKQQENLYLETKFPIYKINELKLNCLGVCLLSQGLSVRNEWERYDSQRRVYYTLIASTLCGATKVSGENKVALTFTYTAGGSAETVSGTTTFSGNIFTYTKENGHFTKVESISISGSASTLDNQREYTFNNNFDYFVVSLKMSSLYYFAGETGFFASDEVKGFLCNATSSGAMPMMVQTDITKLVKENNERSLLEKNYLLIHEVHTIDDLSKILYGTVGYSIGGKTIEGFSSYFTETKKRGLFSYTYGQTYIETFYEWLKDNTIKDDLSTKLKKAFGLESIDTNWNNSAAFSLFSPGDFIKFTQFTFNIRYQPLNSFNLSFVKNKNDIDFPLEQYSSGESGITDFDRLSLNQQESVDRIGNPTLFVSQRITPDQFALGYLRGGTDFKPTYYMKDGVKNTIFQRTYTVGNYKYDVNYTGSANAILKDYFTSIRTKYRAYEYVGLSNSTLRKEKDVIYVRIGENYFNGDDKVYFADGDSDRNFILGIRNEYNNKGFKYVCEKSKNKSNLDETIKNDISLISNDSGIAIIYEQFDNVSAGPYVANSSYSTYYEHDPEEETEEEYQERLKLGGVPQAWQEWNLGIYSDNHQVFYTSSINYYDEATDTLFFDNIQKAVEQVNVAAKAPILPTEAQQIKAGSNVMYICDDNKHHEYGRTFYKDGSERLNHTVQFIYYPASDNIVWTENFIANNGLIENGGLLPNAVFVSNNMNINKNPHAPGQNDSFHFWTSGSPDEITAEPALDGKPAHIKVNWRYAGSNLIYKLCHYDAITGQIADFIAFKRPDTNTTETKFYVTLNDTKSDYVMDVTPQGVLYRRYKVATNVNDRTVVNIYNEQ